MIGRITGQASQQGERLIIIEAGNVGYLVHVLPELFVKARGQILSVWTHLAVREDALDLYGFEHQDELRFFELLVSVPGIGPKSALSILSLAPPPILRQAITSGKTEYLTQVSGIGRKSAEKIILELRDKLERITETETDLAADEDTLEALKALGYNLRQSREALKKIPAETTGATERIKAALKILSQSR